MHIFEIGFILYRLKAQGPYMLSTGALYAYMAN